MYFKHRITLLFESVPFKIMHNAHYISNRVSKKAKIVRLCDVSYVHYLEGLL